MLSVRWLSSYKVMTNILVECGASIAVICLAYALGHGLWLLFQIPTSSWREMAFDYVYVNDDGSVRELTKEKENIVGALFLRQRRTSAYSGLADK